MFSMPGATRLKLCLSRLLISERYWKLRQAGPVLTLVQVIYAWSPTRKPAASGMTYSQCTARTT